jgi:hypothetical protein
MTYTKTTWVNGESPAVNASNLNNIETGIDEAHQKVLIDKDITLSSTSWVDDTGTSGYWYCEITDSEVDTDVVVDFAVHLDDLEDALKFLNNVSQSFSGYYRIYAYSEPTADIVIDVKKVK